MKSGRISDGQQRERSELVSYQAVVSRDLWPGKFWFGLRRYGGERSALCGINAGCFSISV
jgi:hypothetical protein